MKKIIIIACISFLIAAFKPADPGKEKVQQVNTAVNKSLQLLQASSHTFLVNAATCVSCHGQGLGAVAFSLAKENGYTVKEEIISEAVDSICHTWQHRVAVLAQNDDPTAIIMSGSYGLWGLSATGFKATKTTELLAQNIMRRQNNNGNWVSPNLRPPLEYYSFTATALAIKNSLYFIPTVQKDELNGRIAKAVKWLVATRPETNEEKTFQLLGLVWAGVTDKQFIQQQAVKLLSAQHKDGGWSQLDSLPGDAYATGQSLYALQQSGQIQTNAAAYQAGIDFLLRTQFPDGSWKVNTRSFPSVPFVESGFPHGDHQFISAAGSNWATMALVLFARGPTK